MKLVLKAENILRLIVLSIFLLTIPVGCNQYDSSDADAEEAAEMTEAEPQMDTSMEPENGSKDAEESTEENQEEEDVESDEDEKSEEDEEDDTGEE